MVDQVLLKTETITSPENILVDEQMVPYTGALDIKQYIRGKSSPRGIKIFMLFKKRRNPHLQWLLGEEEKKEFGLGSGIVLALVSRVHLFPYKKLFFENFSISIPHPKEWKRRGFTVQVS